MKMKRKSNHKKNKKDEEVKLIEKGTYNDFIVLDKENDIKTENKEDKKETNIQNNESLSKDIKTDKEIQSKEEDVNELLKDWIILDYPHKKKAEKSRFEDLFKEIEKENKKKKKDEIKEEDNENLKIEDNENLKKEDSTQINSSLNLNLSSQITIQSTTMDSKTIEAISINDSLFDNINISQIIENKNLEESKEKIEELNMNLDINKVISLEDKRTTIMIKNIPNKFNKDLLLSIINQNFKGTYDLFILPTDINKFKNFGYSFINFTSSYYIPYFYYMFNGKMWSSTNSKKVCELTYSKVQGKKNLLGHYPSKIVYGNEEAFNVTPEQKYIIPNIYKLVFYKYFPKQKIEEYKYYFITKIPTQ
jgi:hypothetical protein